MTDSDQHGPSTTSIALVSGLIGTIAGILIAFYTIATSPLHPQLTDLCIPFVIAEAITCLLLLAHAIINRLGK